MNNMKDFGVVIGILLLLVVGFYAMWILVGLLVGIVIYAAIPFVRDLLSRRPKRWK